MLTPKKLLVLLLALLMVLASFTACGENNNNQNTDSTETETEGDKQQATGSESTTDDGYVSPIDDDRFTGTVLNVLSWKASNITEYEETTTEQSSQVEKAVFDRCDAVEKRLDLKSKWNLIAGTGADTAFIETAEMENNNGGKYDMIVNVSNFSHSLALKGVYSNLLKYEEEYFDFAHAAWPQSLLDDITVGNKLFFVTGDISTNLIFMTSVVFFNKNLVKDLGINAKIETLTENECKDLYELVEEGKWTLDTMLALCENVYKDQNNDGKKNTGDRFGLNTYRTLFDNFYYGGGYLTITSGEDGFEVSENFMDAVMMGDLLTKINTFFDSKDGLIEGGNGHGPTQTNFADGNVLFSMAPASHAYHTHSNKADLEYSVLPIPKHKETQATYSCTQSFPYSMYGICSHGKNRDAAAAFMQGLAEASNEITRPALFDKMMKGRYSEDPEDAKMWDYAVNANVFDVGRVFVEAFGEDRTEQLTVTLFRNKIDQANDNWVNVLQSYAGPLATYASGLAEIVLNIPD